MAWVEVLLTHIDHRQRAVRNRYLHPCLIAWRAGDDHLDAFGHQQLQAKQSHWPGAGYQRRIAGAHLGNLGDGLHHCSERFTQRCFFQTEVRRNAVQLIGPHDHVAGKRTVNPVTHAAALGAKDEMARATVGAFPAGHSGGAQARDSLADVGLGDAAPYLHHRAGKLMAQNYRRIIAKGVVKHVQIRSADSTEGNFELDLVVAAPGLIHFPDVDMAVAGGVLH